MLCRTEISSMCGLMSDNFKIMQNTNTALITRKPLLPVSRTVILLLVVFSFAGQTNILCQQTSDYNIDKAYNILNRRGEVIIRFKIPENSTSDLFSALMSVDRVKGDTITAYLNRVQFDRFVKSGIVFTVVDPPSLKTVKAEPEIEKDLVSFVYPSYNEYITLMHEFAASWPDLCMLTVFGTSAEGRDLLALKISDNALMKEAEPVLFFTSTMHGDEVTGYVLMLRLIQELLQNYSTSQRIRNIVDNIEIWINPLANPDGTYFLTDESVYGSTRFNANNIDLNRNFPDPELGDHPDNEEWQPETVAMMNFMEEKRVTLSANFHGGAEVINYPWDTWQKTHADDGWFNLISRSWADTAHLNSMPGYMTDENNGVTRGYEWYRITGGRQDYATYFLHSREITVEISATKVPDESELESYWLYNRESILDFMELLFTGVKGTVSDIHTGMPVAALVVVESHDVDQSHVVSDIQNGYYHRLLLPGDYSFTFSAAGYKEYCLNVNVHSAGSVVLDVMLEPLEGKVFYPNPFNEHVKVYLRGSEPEFKYEIYDLSGSIVEAGHEVFTGDGFQLIHVPEVAKGSYILRITHDGEIYTGLIVKQ